MMRRFKSLSNKEMLAANSRDPERKGRRDQIIHAITGSSTMFQRDSQLSFILLEMVKSECATTHFLVTCTSYSRRSHSSLRMECFWGWSEGMQEWTTWQAWKVNPPSKQSLSMRRKKFMGLLVCTWGQVPYTQDMWPLKFRFLVIVNSWVTLELSCVHT